MKSILKTALVILAIAAGGQGAWASTDAKPHLTQAQVDQLRADQKQRHQKKAKPTARKVDGRPNRGPSGFHRTR
jgi:hypothetical protein